MTFDCIRGERFPNSNRRSLISQGNLTPVKTDVTVTSGHEIVQGLYELNQYRPWLFYGSDGRTFNDRRNVSPARFSDENDLKYVLCRQRNHGLIISEKQILPGLET